MNVLGIRKEDKNKWEKRAPIIPKDVGDLVKNHSCQFIVQSSDNRAFSDNEYEEEGAIIENTLENADVIFAVKEIPSKLISQKVYIFFSHVIKGQRYNMPMLKKILKENATLIDYEKVVDSKGRRLIFFGNWAGLSGINETLWGYGQRLLKIEGIQTPFLKLKHTFEYNNVEEQKKYFEDLSKDIEKNGLNLPIFCGFAGYGNVSKGAQSFLDILPVIEIDPNDLKSFFEEGNFSKNHVYKIVFKEEHLVEPNDPNHKFDLQDYYDNGLDKYHSKFHEYLPYLTILVNALFWSAKYPRLIRKEGFKSLIKENSRLKIIGDISIDIEGAIEGSLESTKPDNPIITYDPFTDSTYLGLIKGGMPIMAIDNLPCELPKESSISFSSTLKEYVLPIANADFKGNFDKLNLPSEIKDAIIVYQGKLTPNYTYLEKYLQ
ncbi:hypothetical protein DSAG12_00560 [Promethearchaeum syntrophicum]|uniref:Alanine dehydrogenase/pyridine nucleotide transhydrogenase N-terminal domain-containing protein n=1 Tax=Promethearchaeum syntrophicum TaxID=2594042 RepID=A0A5B9D6X4_9ARCH|nr:hypothetical protein [Candidatus Prometheoarchaeum syntrophicum]QEE14745.1 hypothetical protein DSAG12_00560 [Candidatus Prometheoarchaeum syntrophicum]